MRRVHFTWIDRLLVVPVELTLAFRYFLLVALTLWLTAGLLAGGWQRAGGLLLLTGAAFLGGTVVTPLLLPWLPGRMFAVKGAVVGVALVALFQITGFLTHGCGVRSVREVAAWWFLMPAISSFLAMNFTGATTFTSQSGVVREMRQTVPFMTLGAIAGLILFVIAQLGHRG
jgi:acetyl-CoA decarbonylase/synthase complex subunit gamma